MLSDDEWAQVACEIMHRTGLAPYGQEDEAVRWVAVRHAADHIHLVAVLAHQDGTRPRLWNDYYRIGEACRAAEDRFGLRATAPRDRTAARRGGRGIVRAGVSPASTPRVSASASGSAPATPARSPVTRSPSPPTPPRPVARSGTAAGNSPRPDLAQTAPSLVTGRRSDQRREVHRSRTRRRLRARRPGRR
jgi:hypothetical protein